MQLNTTDVTPKTAQEVTAQQATIKYVKNLLDVPIYADTYRLARYIVHITANTPKNLTHVSERVQLDVLELSTYLYETFSTKSNKAKLKRISKIESMIGRIAFQIKLMLDLKITSHQQSKEILYFIGTLQENLEKWENEVHAKCTTK